MIFFVVGQTSPFVFVFFFQFTLSLGLWVAAIRHFRLGRGFGNRKKTKQYSNVSYGEPQP